MSSRLMEKMREHGFYLRDVARWTNEMSLFTTGADVDRMVRWAVGFRSHGAAQDEARDWWNRFTSLLWTLRYRARRHSPESAREVFRAFPRYEIHDWRWTPTMLEKANAWVMTALPPERVHAYLRLRVSPREALREWEPRPDCAATIAFMLALTPGVER